MGLSHLAIAKPHPDVKVVAVCDSTAYLVDALESLTSIKGYTDYNKLLANEKLDAVIIATPSRFHTSQVQAALDANLHVFCEKPFCLNVAEGRRLVGLAESKKLINQVGYHYRFVGTFYEAKRLLDLNSLGSLHHIRAEAFGPVVVRSKGMTWRAMKSEGGGCLYDYACHAIDLMNYLIEPPQAVSGTVLNRIFSSDVEDEVYSTLFYDNGITGHVAANWSDESQRKMSTKISVWGTDGKLIADRQELHLYLRDQARIPEGFNPGWNTRYTTDLTENVNFYLRGEEYSAQIEHFFYAIKTQKTNTRNTFRSAIDTDIVLAAMVRNASHGNVSVSTQVEDDQTQSKTTSWDSLRYLWRSATTTYQR
jgi:predicted dehydrogenase